jgi:hypothetical protein
MVGSAQEEALKIIEVQLRPFVERELKSKYGVNWLEKVNEVRAGARSSPPPLPLKDGVVRWSPDDLLNTMVVHFQSVFANSFIPRQDRRGGTQRPDYVALGWINEILEFRRQWAHVEGYSQEQVVRFLSTCQLLLIAAGATEGADRIGRLKPRERPSLLIRQEGQQNPLGGPVATLKPNMTIKRMLSRLPPDLAVRWRQTAIDGAVEIFGCPDPSGSHGGLDFEQFLCTASNTEWPQDIGGLSSKQEKELAVGLIGDGSKEFTGWLTQKGKPGRVRMLLGPIDPPNLDRPYISFEVGNSDYFTPRTISELEKLNLTGAGPDLYSIFPESWAEPGSRFPPTCVPYHVSVQGIVISHSESEGDHLILGSVNPQNPSITHGWGATMAEQMWAPDPSDLVKEWWRPFAAKRLANVAIPSKREGDADLRENLRRGLREELGITLGTDTLQNPRLLSVAIEENFFITFVFLVIVRLGLDDIYKRWKVAPDTNEMGLLAAYKFGGRDKDGRLLNGAERLSQLLSKDRFDAGPHLLPSPRPANELIGKWHCSSRLRIYAAGMHFWPNHFPSYVTVEV